MVQLQDVEKQLEGEISFRELPQSTWDLHRNFEAAGYDDPGNARGWQSLQLLAGRLEIAPLDP